MSNIYLIRHGRPAVPDAQTYCLGCGSDPPLCDDGRRQARALTGCFDGLAFACINSSALRRSLETAELISNGRWGICASPDLNEIGVGQWEGLSFDKIKMRYPGIYAARGRDWAICPPDGESLENAAARMEKALRLIASAEIRDVLAVTHDGLIRALLWQLLKPDTKKDAMMRLPYGSITVLKYDCGELRVTAIGLLPDDFPSDAELDELWDFCDTPEAVRAHSRAVCDEALRIQQHLTETGVPLSNEPLRTAALLHDMCRRDGREHPISAARLLRERGYMKVAYTVERHHGGALRDGIDEAQVLYLADKRVDGIRRVTLQERFSASRARCVTVEAVKSHEARYREALKIQEKIENIMGRKLRKTI